MGKKILLIFFCATIVCLSNISAQATKQRNIYLWDVTLSMKGYKGKTPNVYNDVVKYLIDQVASQDITTEIVVIPFQEGALEVWTEQATTEGKERLKDRIRKYNNTNLTNTDIVKAIDYAEKIIKSGKENRDNFIVVLTDGKQSECFGGAKALYQKLNSWPEFSKLTESFMVYVMLTKGAADQKISEIFDDTTGVAVGINEPWRCVRLKPHKQITANIKDDKYITIPMDNVREAEKAENVKITYKIHGADTILKKVSGKITLKNSKLQIPLELLHPYEQTKKNLPDETSLSISLCIQKTDHPTGMTIIINPVILNLTLKNRPEKTLKIGIKK